MIICGQVREKIRGMDKLYVKRKPIQLNQAEAYYLHVYDSVHSYNRIILYSRLHM